MSRVETLRRSIEPLFNDIRNVNEVAEKIIEIDDAFHCFENAHFDYIAMISDDAEERKRKHGILQNKFAKRWTSMRK